MALKPRAKIAIVLVTVAAAGGGLAAALLSEPPPKKGKGKKNGKNGDQGDGTDDGTGEPGEMGSGGTPFVPGVGVQPRRPGLGGQVTPPGAVTSEPVGGWENRWAEVGPAIFEECRDEVGGEANLSWSGAFTEYTRCVARKAFPETAARLDPSEWPAWLKGDAMARIRSDLNAYLTSKGVSNQGWTFMLWLRFDGVIEGCYEALAPSVEGITHCAASEIYPERDWPPEVGATWENDFWAALMEQVEAYVDIQETGGAAAGYSTTPLPGPAG